MKSTAMFWLLLAGITWGAPLFPPTDHDQANEWLRSLGLGDRCRASTRWEVALQLSRAQQLLQAGLAPLLSKAEVEQLQNLLEAYRPELEQMGGRLQTLEERLELLDQRVSEQGRIRFSGQFRSSFVSTGASNTGNPRGGFGPGALNYDDLVGSINGANLAPLNPLGVQPVIDFGSGRPIFNAGSFTSALLLNVEADVSEDLLAQLRLYAYSSQGNPLLDAVWGVQQPTAANPFAAGSSPFTSMGLDQLALTHLPSATTLTVGSFLPRYISPQVYMGTVNPRVGQTRLLESYGLHLAGEWDNQRWGWEIFGTRLYDGNPGVTAPYRSYALGAALNYRNADWTGSVSGLRAQDDNALAPALTVGQTTNFNQAAGLGLLNWVNPPGFYTGQLGGPGSPLVAGVGTQTDSRPLSGIPNSDAGGARATMGPQQLTMGSVHLEYAPGEYSLKADYGLSDYRPSRNSSYSTQGALWRVGAATELFDKKLHLELDYRSTDARYDPMVLQFASPMAGLAPLRVYHRVPDQDQFWQFWSLHNTNDFPHNRQGFWFNARYQYDPDGAVSLSYRNLAQVSTSLQDVRVQPGSLGLATPNALVLGFSPGFIDTVFREFSPLSFDANLQPLENPRGHVSSYAGKLSHVFTGSPWKLDVSYDSWTFRRPTSLAAAQGGSQNLVDLTYALGDLAVGRRFGENVLVTLGCQRSTIHGHYDPGGVYNPLAIATQQIDFLTRDLVQTNPYLKLDWNVSEGVRFGSEFMLYYTLDRVPSAVVPGPLNGVGATAHPFSWNGHRIGTTLEVDF
jgi:hypothetical protein